MTPTPSRSSASKLFRTAGQILLGLAAAIFLLPKLTLLDHAERALWSDFELADRARILAQDAVLLVVVTLGLAASLRRVTLARVLLAGSVSGLLLFTLFMDLRVRELYFKPLDLDLILYTV